jgi:hypothetical protein
MLSFVLSSVMSAEIWRSGVSLGAHDEEGLPDASYHLPDSGDGVESICDAAHRLASFLQLQRVLGQLLGSLG